MKFFGRLKKIRYIKLNTDAFLYVKLTAQQVDDERTTTDGRAHNS